MNPRFGAGLIAQKNRRLPVGPSAVDREEERGACPTDAPSISDIRARELETSFTSQEFSYARETGLTLTEAREQLEDEMDSYELERLAAIYDSEHFDEPHDFEIDTEYANDDAPENYDGPVSFPIASEVAMRDDEPTGNGFVLPAEVEAVTWARAITGRLKEVAADFQLTFAKKILADDVIWQYDGMLIRPTGESLEELEARLSARESAKKRRRRVNAAQNRRTAAAGR
ncbi:MAG TPA: hypothetical protein VGI80_09750 [Pyrinomonadaceae bacterium]